jgi:hypothetical protein
MKEKKDAAFRALKIVGQAVEAVKHGNTNHVQVTDYI